MASVPPTMQAAVTRAHGGPEVVEVRSDWPVPKPGPGEALVRVAAAAVNNTDVWTRRGAYGTANDPDAIAGWLGIPLEFPRIQGGDITGVVAAIGPDVDQGLVGRRVLVDPIVTYRQGLPAAVVGSETDGGFAEYHVSAAARLHDVTDSPLSDAQLACLPIAYGTAMGMIERANCLASERVLVTGASGGVGSAAVQLLVARGCHVLAFTSAAKVAVVSAFGPAEIVVRDQDELGQIAEVDAVVDVVGGDDFGAIVDRLRDGGRLVACGAIAGPVVAFDIRRLYLRNRFIIGSTMHTEAHFAELARLARAGAVEPLVAEVYPLGDIAIAQARFEQKDFVGKLVLLPGQPP